MRNLSVFEEKNLTCRDCREVFVFSTSEQQFFHERGLVNEPKRCSNCRIVSRNKRKAADGKPAAIAEAACAQCGSRTKVPFEPKGHKPVFCLPCFQSMKNTPSPADS
jgi:CxxC-x17-CxxC domain-containing protein